MKCEIIKCENEATATYAYTSNRYNFCEKCGAGQQEFKEKDLPTSSLSDELACSMRDNFAMSADDSQSTATCSIAWISVKDKLPKRHQVVLVYRPRVRKKLACQVVEWWDNDESEFTHWAHLNSPKQ